MLFLQMSNPRVVKLYCMCLRTMKLWSRWSLKAAVLQWDMFPEPAKLHLIGCLIGLIWTPKSKSNTSTPKTNSLTSYPKEISHVMSGIIFCVLFNIGHLSPTVCSDTMATRSQAVSGEKRVTAKSRHMMNLIARTSSFVSSSIWQNGDIWWIILPGRHRSCRLQLQWARGRDITEVKMLGATW